MLYSVCNDQSINSILKKMHAGDTLILEDGLYREKIDILTDGITLKARNPHQAILSWNDYYHKIMPDGNECNTFRTYTVYIGGDQVTLEGIVIENKAVPSAIYGQAVALHVDGNRFNCLNCLNKGAQDTLFLGPLPNDLCKRYQGFYPPERLKGTPSKQYYKNCMIFGDVDFIFGCATALFEDCTIHSIQRESKNYAYISAPSHSSDVPYGFLFYHCHFSSEEKRPSSFLSRPWRDYGCAAFIECQMDSHILGKGFDPWNNSGREKTARFIEYSPNVDLSARVPWSHQLTEKQALSYVKNFKDYLSF